MARLVARWKRFNLVRLVALRNGNHPGEAYVRRGRRKDLYRRERDSLEGSHEEVEIQCKALRCGKNLDVIKNTCLEKERVPSKVTPRKVGVGLKRRREPSRRRLSWRLAYKLRLKLRQINFVPVTIDASNRKEIKLVSIVARYFLPETGVKEKQLQF